MTSPLRFADPPEAYLLPTRYIRWIRLDARGNKPGVDAQFSLEEERLAFPVRAEMDEIDYRVVHADAHPLTTRTLEAHEDAIAMYASGLPASLD